MHLTWAQAAGLIQNTALASWGLAGVPGAPHPLPLRQPIPPPPPRDSRTLSGPRMKAPAPTPHRSAAGTAPAPSPHSHPAYVSFVTSGSWHWPRGRLWHICLFCTLLACPALSPCALVQCVPFMSPLPPSLTLFSPLFPFSDHTGVVFHLWVPDCWSQCEIYMCVWFPMSGYLSLCV